MTTGSSGFGGNDVIRLSAGFARGAAGNDVFIVYRTGRAFGEAGNDRFVLRGGTSRGGPGKDTFQVLAKGAGTARGDGGADVISFEKVRRSVTASLATGKARWGDRHVTMVGVEVLVGSNKADTLNGTRRGDLLRGSGGDDRLRGQGGNDLLIGDEASTPAKADPAATCASPRSRPAAKPDASRQSSSSTRSPPSTGRVPVNPSRATFPARGAVIDASIFIASIVARVAPASTWSPSATTIVTAPW